MESNHIAYDIAKSIIRIDSILSEQDTSFEELKEIPDRSKLTFTNGFYVNCSALFVDIRGSSKLPEKYRRPTLAKLYRTFLSEVVALINGNSACSEINIVGDCVSGIFNTPYPYTIDEVFVTAYKINTLIQIINNKFSKKGIDPITIGIGLSYGRALMVKAGYSGSSINDIVWMGDVVNEASELCSYGNKILMIDAAIMVSRVFYGNLNDQHKNLLTYNSNRCCYHGNIIDNAMKI
jgi:class 3 adenylate cyclase